jgi:membrane-associated phospholipid phosphatase
MRVGMLVPGRRRRLAIAGLGLALVVLVALVASGALTWLDQFAVDHVMQGLHPGRPRTHEWRGLYRPFGSDTTWWLKVLDTWTYPCSVLISGLVIATVAGVLWRRAEPIAAWAWIGAWVVGNGVEVVGKWVIGRPGLFGTAADGKRVHVSTFDHSFPSGHMIRGLIVAAAVAVVWRRAMPRILLWAGLVAVFLVVTSAHTPSDVAGGALVGTIVVLVANAVGDAARRGAGPPLRGKWTR